MLFRKCAFTPISSSHCAQNVSGTFGSTMSPRTTTWFCSNLEEVQNGIFTSQPQSHFLNKYLTLTLFKHIYDFFSIHMHKLKCVFNIPQHKVDEWNFPFIGSSLESVLGASVSDQIINNPPVHILMVFPMDLVLFLCLFALTLSFATSPLGRGACRKK